MQKLTEFCSAHIKNSCKVSPFTFGTGMISQVSLSTSRFSNIVFRVLEYEAISILI